MVVPCVLHDTYITLYVLVSDAYKSMHIYVLVITPPEGIWLIYKHDP